MPAEASFKKNKVLTRTNAIPNPRIAKPMRPPAIPPARALVLSEFEFDPEASALTVEPGNWDVPMRVMVRYELV